MRAIDFIQEGVQDPAIFKVVFIIGGPGSGKSYISQKLGLSALGYTTINSDIAFEYLMLARLSHIVADGYVIAYPFLV